MGVDNSIKRNDKGVVARLLSNSAFVSLFIIELFGVNFVVGRKKGTCRDMIKPYKHLVTSKSLKHFFVLVNVFVFFAFVRLLF